MIKNIVNVSILIFTSSCSYIAGPEGMFPSKEYDFLYERIEEDISFQDGIDIVEKEDHFPIENLASPLEKQDTPKPRQIFSSDQNNSVQLRRLGELMWIYVETLPSSSWPITKSYWENSQYQVIDMNPDIGEISVSYDELSYFNMKIEHGIKEASTEIFLNILQKSNNELISNPELIQSELSNLVNYFAQPNTIIAGTSLAAQNLNDRKKAKIFIDGEQTVIELDLNFDRAWSSVSRSIDAANIIINDRNRSKGILYVSNPADEKSGFFAFLRKNNKDSISNDAEFEVRIIEIDKKTFVRVYSIEDGKIEESEVLLSKINESLS